MSNAYGVSFSEVSGGGRVPDAPSFTLSTVAIMHVVSVVSNAPTPNCLPKIQNNYIVVKTKNI